MKLALRPGGIVCTQAECQWLHLDIIKNLIELGKSLFTHAEYAYTTIPTYPCGQIGFLLGSLGGSCKVPQRKLESDVEVNYYNPELHAASFVLPNFAKKSFRIINKNRLQKLLPL
jgi:spermidine synthase